MSAEFHVSSLLVHCQTERLTSIATAIDDIAEAEVHAVDPCGKLIVSLETSSEFALQDRLSAIRGLSGVLSASLVYHQVDHPNGP